MTSRVHHVVLVAIISLPIAACGDDGPCLEGGEDGDCVVGETEETEETGGKDPECAPFDGSQSGTSLICQGDGTGWLVTDVYGAGDANPITTCLAYEAQEIPNNPTADDCASVPLDLIPHEIPAPTACCTDEALPDEIIDTCMRDCGYAACKTAIAAMRDAADLLMAPDGLPQGPFDTSKADLYAYADVLEVPANLKYCANKVRSSPGQVVSIDLDSGASNPTAFGHINNATVFLGCGLDLDAPYVADPQAGECTEATNITTPMAQIELQGEITAGALQVTGPGVETLAPITDASVLAREILNSDMSVDFTLSSFDATVLDVAVGSFEFRDAQIHLVAPASGTLNGQTATFAPGTLRLEVTATVLVDGLSLFGGLPMAAEYANTATATAIHGLGGSFHFVDATFTTGGYTAVLNTEPSVLNQIQ